MANESCICNRQPRVSLLMQSSIMSAKASLSEYPAGPLQFSHVCSLGKTCTLSANNLGLNQPRKSARGRRTEPFKQSASPTFLRAQLVKVFGGSRFAFVG